MKTYIKRAAVLFAVLITMASCTKKVPSQADVAQRDEKPLSIVATIFPAYDWARQIVGNQPTQHVELTLLIDSGADLHSFQPAVQDIARIATADVFIYVGGESDEWVADALKTVRNKNMAVISLLAALGDRAKEEELAEGMETEADEDEEEEEPEYDEHVWLSLKNARMLVHEIATVLCAVDEKNAATYRANAAAYDKELATLDAAYAEAVSAANRKTLLFCDRFPFRYLVDDYGLSYYAAFSGCSAETEASFQTVAFLAQKLAELSLPCVIQLEGSSGKLSRTVIENSTHKTVAVYTLNSLQSTTARDVQDGATYLGAMEQNLAVLTAALY